MQVILPPELREVYRQNLQAIDRILMDFWRDGRLATFRMRLADRLDEPLSAGPSAAIARTILVGMEMTYVGRFPHGIRLSVLGGQVNLAAWNEEQSRGR